MHIELDQHVADVRRGGTPADEEGLADLAVRLALGDQDQDFLFAGCEERASVGLKVVTVAIASFASA